MRNASLTAALVLILTACASTGGTRSGGTPDLITSEELRSAEGITNLYQAVQRLRPRFLQGRIGSRSARVTTGVVVYFDGVRLGGVRELGRIGIDGIAEVRYLGARDATTKYGTNHGSGVIEVASTR